MPRCDGWMLACLALSSSGYHSEGPGHEVQCCEAHSQGSPSMQIDGETVETVSDFIFGAPKSLQMVIAAMKLRDAYSLEGKL